MSSTTTIKNLPDALKRRLARKADANHRSFEGEILHRLACSLATDEAEERLRAHLQRALTAERSPMVPDDVLNWAEETFDHLERPARKK